MSTELKKCSLCMTDRPLSHFNVIDSSSGKLRSHCRSCRGHYTRERRKRIDLQELGDRVCTSCGFKKSVRDFHISRDSLGGRATHCKACKSKDHQYRRYGLTEAEVNNLYQTQNGLCALCGEPLNHKFSIDHNHSSGKVRGLIHQGCNFHLAGFEMKLKDGRLFMDAAIEYLNRG